MVSIQIPCSKIARAMHHTVLESYLLACMTCFKLALGNGMVWKGEVTQQLSGDVPISSSADVGQHAKVALAGGVEG